MLYIGGKVVQQSYYIFSNGEIKRNDNTLQLIKEDGTKGDIPIERVYDIYVFSEMRFNTKLINFLAQKGVCVHFFNYYEYYSGTFYARESHVSGDLLIHQVKHYIDYEKRKYLACEFLKAGAQNIYRNLRYYNEREKELEDQMNQIEGLFNSLKYARTINELMGIEGNIRKIYYNSWNTIISADIDFEKRVKRPPDNIINTLISFLNSLLYTKIVSEIYRTQLNPTISYLHEPSEKRFSLSLDISEVFKPLIVDRMIFSLLNKNMINENDFEKDLNFLRIKDSVIKTITQEFDKRMQKTIKHKTLNRDVSYKHLMRLELYKLIKHLLGEKNYKGFRIWW